MSMSVQVCRVPFCYSTDGVRPIGDDGEILLCKQCRSYQWGELR